MPLAPYRSAPDAQDDELPSRGSNRDVAIPLALFWCVSVLHVALAIARDGTFDTGATIALVAVIFVPVAFLKSIGTGRGGTT